MTPTTELSRADEAVKEPEREMIERAWGALNFILAFYEPDQRHLDTEAWKVAEASGRRARAELKAWLDRPAIEVTP